MKNMRFLVSMSFCCLFIGNVILARGLLRADFLGFDFDEVFEGLEQRRVTAFQHCAEELNGLTLIYKEFLPRGGYEARQIFVPVNKTETGVEIAIPVTSASSKKADIEYFVESEMVIAKVPLKQGTLEVQVGEDSLRMVQSFEEKGGGKDQAQIAAHNCIETMLPARIDPKSVEVVHDEAAGIMKLMFAEKQAKTTKIMVKGLDVKAEKTSATNGEKLEQSEDSDLK